MALLFVTVTGNLGPAAAGAKGYWVPTGWLVDAPDMRVFPPAPEPPFTIAADGTFTSGPLLAQDSTGPQPTGEAWQLTITGIDGVAPFSQTYSILHANGATQDLSALATVVPDPVFVGFLTLLYPTGAQDGFVWTTDAAGNGSWQPPAVTGGVLYLPAVVGPPSGPPALKAGTVPVVFDTVNSQIWAFSSGEWEAVTVS